MKNIKIELYVRTVKMPNGSTFKSYSAKDKNNNWYNVKFTKEIVDVPVSHCNIFVKKEKANIDTRNKYPRLWISGIESVEIIERPTEDLGQYFEEC